MFKFIGITKKFNTTTILKNVSFDIEELDWIMLSGESGCGKTTLLKIMTGLLEYEEGEIVYDNKKVNFKELNHLRKSDFSIVFQEKNLLSEYTVYQNLVYTASYNHISKEIIDELLIKFDLMELKFQKVNQLSSGQQQKIALIKSLLNQSRILFLDEPTGNLDDQSTYEFMEMLKIINKDMTIVMITHNKELFQFANKVLEINNKKIINKKNERKEVISPKLHLKSCQKYFSHKMMFKMAIWNFLYYKKTYLLGIFIFSLLCIGMTFSNFIGKNINNDIRKVMIERDVEYEVNIASNDIFSKEEIKTISDETNAKDYDLKLQIFSSNVKNITINDNQDISGINKIQFKSTYDIVNPKQDIYLSSSLYDELKKQVSNIEKIKLQTEILSELKTKSTMHWVQKEFNRYIPIYQNANIEINNFQIIDSKDYIVYLDNYIIESLANQFNKSDISNSNQQIKFFKLKYSNYQDLLDAIKYLSKYENLNIFSIYDDFHKIQQSVEEQFLIFSYSSYILAFISVIVLIFILLILERNKVQQSKILYEQGISIWEQLFISIYEIGFFIILTLSIALVGIYLITSLFNYKYDVITFLPYSVIEFATTYNLPIQNLKLFSFDVLYTLKFLCLISFPTIMITIMSGYVKNAYHHVSAK